MTSLLRRVLREVVLPLAFFLAVFAPLRSSVVDWNWVPTGSMKPTILEGDLVLVNKLAYDLKVPFTTRRVATWGDPARGEVVVFASPQDGSRLVKRVVGLPGDTIELRRELLLVNGVAQPWSRADAGPFVREIPESRVPVVAVEHLGDRPHYVLVMPDRGAMRSFGPFTVPAGHYFMMGDSRDNSYDSRYFGPVARAAIAGRASAVLASFDTARGLTPRVGRFGHPLAALVSSPGG